MTKNHYCGHGIQNQLICKKVTELLSHFSIFISKAGSRTLHQMSFYLGVKKSTRHSSMTRVIFLASGCASMHATAFSVDMCRASGIFLACKHDQHVLIQALQYFLCLKPLGLQMNSTDFFFFIKMMGVFIGLYLPLPGIRAVPAANSSAGHRRIAIKVSHGCWLIKSPVVPIPPPQLAGEPSILSYLFFQEQF